MIASITIRGLGGHDDTTLDLDPAGANELAGPSGAGKSTTLLAICFCLWGCDTQGSPLPVEAIRDGHDRAEVSVTLASGLTFTRGKTRKGTISRTVTRAGTTTAYPNEGLFTKEMKKLGEDPEAVRVALVPLAWRTLTGAPGNGMKLRNLIARLLPPGDLRAEVARLMAEAGAEMRSNDPVDPKVVEEMRAAAKKRAAEAKGALEEAGRRQYAPTTTGGEAPTEAALLEARATIALAAAWRKHDAAAEGVAAGRAAVERAAVAAADWKARRAALGERPEVPAAGVELAARQAVDAADRAVTETGRARDRAIAAIGTAEGQVAEAERADDAELVTARRKAAAAHAEHAQFVAAGDTCPTCERPGWTAAAKKIEIAAGALTGAEAYVSALQGNADARREKRLATLRAAVEAARAARAEAEAAHTAAVEAAAIARADAAVTVEARRTVNAWDAQLAALGGEPVVGAAPAGAIPPAAARPAASEEEAAVATIRAAEHAQGAAAQAARQAAADKAAVERAGAEAASTAAEATRLEALVAAVRKAPSEIARAQAAALGELGPVTLDFPAGGGCEVLIDGRPWWLASEGELRHADLYLRLAIRRALRMAWLMVVVDNAQDWSGEWPAGIGAVCFLRTEAGEGLTVRRAADRLAAK